MNSIIKEYPRGTRSNFYKCVHQKMVASLFILDCSSDLNLWWHWIRFNKSNHDRSKINFTSLLHHFNLSSYNFLFSSDRFSIIFVSHTVTAPSNHLDLTHSDHNQISTRMSNKKVLFFSFLFICFIGLY